MKVYVATGTDGYISAYHTSNEFTAFEEVEQESPTIDISKLQGYKIQDRKLIFDEDQYAAYVAEQEKEAAIESGTELMEELANQKILLTAANEEAYAMRYLYPEWSPNGVKYYKEQWPNRVIFEDKFYKVEQDHTSQESWKPSDAPSLFTEIPDPNEEWPEYKQPTHAENAYMKDDKITYNGKHYQSNIDNNVWSPDDYPAGWRLVEEGE